MILAVLLLSGITKADNVSADYQVVPLPNSITISQKSPFVLSSRTPIVYAVDNEDLKRNAVFLADYIADIAGFRPEVSKGKAKNAIVLQIDKKVKAPEGYVLTVDNKQISIKGSTPQGIFYGIQTLRKSLPVARKPGQIVLPAVIISDQPRFSYRGMMLDCARHFFPVSFVKRYIDLIALHNMNVFHWHITDDQGWRFESKKYPKLTEIGSKRSETVIGRLGDVFDGKPYGGYYTQEECREIVKYAADRYITVIPEVDMPGHMQAALAAYPELGCTGGPYETRKVWGISTEVLCLGNPKTYQFCEDILGELMDVFPSKIIHIGGDETPTKRWAADPKDKAVMEKENLSLEKLQGYFTNRIEKFVNSRGRRILGWDELLQGDIQNSTMIMNWRGLDYGIKAVRKGHDIVMAPTEFAYLDYYQTKDTWREPLLIGGNLPIEKTYSFEPFLKELTQEEKSHILGVQANLWTEYIDNPNLAEYQVLPRMCAIADIQWSTAPKDFNAFKNRLTRFTNLLDLYHFDYGKQLWPEKRTKENIDD